MWRSCRLSGQAHLQRFVAGKKADCFRMPPKVFDPAVAPGTARVSSEGWAPGWTGRDIVFGGRSEAGPLARTLSDITRWRWPTASEGSKGLRSCAAPEQKRQLAEKGREGAGSYKKKAESAVQQGGRIPAAIRRPPGPRLLPLLAEPPSGNACLRSESGRTSET